MEFKKSELTILLIQLQATKGDKEIGLLNEKISLGLKRRLAKIQSKAYALYQEYLKDRKEAETDPKELEILNNETVTIEADKVSMVMLEAIESTTSYNWEILEKIAE